MPFHAFLSVWAGSIIGHQALIQSWKELLAVIIVALSLTIILKDPQRLQRFRNPLFYFIGGFIAIGLLVTLIARPNLTAAIFGIKTDIEFLVLFGVAFLVAERKPLTSMTKIILVTSALVAVIGILLSFVLAPDFLKLFGYGPNTILPYRLIGPQSFGIRTPSTLGGPNQFGAFLILPLCLSVAMMVKRWRWWQIPLTLVLVGGIAVSYSRSAWLGAAIGVLMILLALVRSKRALLVIVIILGVIGTSAIYFSFNTIKNSDLSYYLLHQSTDAQYSSNSTTQHETAFSLALTTLKRHPWGFGLGSSGPASFHGGVANIPENYYLQLALETGVIGLLAFLGIIGVLGWRLFRERHRSLIALALFGALVGLSVENLFLHGWADSSTAFVFWIMAGSYVGSLREGETHGE
jgi:O-antigen ligase